MIDVKSARLNSIDVDVSFAIMFSGDLQMRFILMIQLISLFTIDRYDRISFSKSKTKRFLFSNSARMSSNRMKNASITISELLKEYDIRLRPSFGGKSIPSNLHP